MSKTSEFRGEIPPAVSQLKEATREAHEAIQAMRQEKRELEVVRDEVKQLRDEGLMELFAAVRENSQTIITAVIDTEMAEYRKLIEESIELAEKNISQHFDDLMKNLTNTSASALRAGQPDLYDLIEAVGTGSLKDLPDFQLEVAKAAEKQAQREREIERRKSSAKRRTKSKA